jgi:hypothetical protein
MATNPPAYESGKVFDEFSPKKLILLGRSALWYLLRQWWKVLGIGLLFGVAGAFYSLSKKPTFAAEISFALDEEAAQSASPGYRGLAEELGLGISPNPGGVFSSMTNIVELMKSRLLIEKTLLSSTVIDGRKIIFADFFLDSLRFREKWMKKSPYYQIRWDQPHKTKEETLFANAILRSMYETLVTRNISIASKGKGTTIISAKLTAEHELFCKYFLEALMAEVTNYYVQIKTQRAKLNLEFIQQRTDSIRVAYNSALFGRAAFTDANINPIRQTAVISGEKQQTDIQILKASYIDLVSALEEARTALRRDTPLIQYLDTPILPLNQNRSSMKKWFILFFIVGCLLTTFFLLTRKGIRYIMSS